MLLCLLFLGIMYFFIISLKTLCKYNSSFGSPATKPYSSLELLFKSSQKLKKIKKKCQIYCLLI